jgi:hypothetical protein
MIIIIANNSQCDDDDDICDWYDMHVCIGNVKL